MKKILVLTIAVGFAGLSAVAMAQAPAAPAAADVIPKPACGDLPEMVRKAAPDSQKRFFERSLREYGSCLQGYVKERNASITAQQKATQAYVDGYNQLLTKYTAEKEAAEAK